MEIVLIRVPQIFTTTQLRFVWRVLIFVTFMFRLMDHQFVFRVVIQHKLQPTDNVWINVATSSNHKITLALHPVLQECSMKTSNVWIRIRHAISTSAFTHKRCVSILVNIWLLGLSAFKTAASHTPKTQMILHSASGCVQHSFKTALVLINAILEFMIKKIECAQMTGPHANFITIIQLMLIP